MLSSDSLGCLSAAQTASSVNLENKTKSFIWILLE